MSETAASDQVRQFTVSVEDDGIRLDRWFKRNLPDATFNIVSRWSRTGQLRVDGKRASPGDRIDAGQGIRVPPAVAHAAPMPRVEAGTLSEGEDDSAGEHTAELQSLRRIANAVFSFNNQKH